MSYEDKNVLCVDCGAEFIFGAAEQQLFASKGFVNGPKRCKACREARKAAHGNRTGSGNTMSNAPAGNFNRGSNTGGTGGGYGSGGGGRREGRGSYSARSNGGGRGNFGGGGDRGPRQLFPATCASCGQQTEVPFKPTGARPVYCRECFQAQRPQG